MKPASDISDFSLQTVLAVAPAEDQPEAPVRHHVLLDDRRCTCGQPREQCVRRRMRAMWGT
ncbi:MAG: hypothetical protein JWP76_1510 [Dactylosporangium sp.]|jgi:hypothetical protein|nr:hypothetical protein [Dactylosporangium sp.]